MLFNSLRLPSRVAVASPSAVKLRFANMPILVLCDCEPDWERGRCADAAGSRPAS